MAKVPQDQQALLVNPRRLPADGFRVAFSKVVEQTLNTSSVSANRNRPLESLMADQTGWPTIGVKFISASKQIKNRISELRNRPERLAHALLLIPEGLKDGVVRLAVQYVGSGGFSIIAIATHDSNPPQITDLVLTEDDDAARANVLLEAFPKIKVHRGGKLPQGGGLVALPSGDSMDVASIEDFVDQTGVAQSKAEAWLRRLRQKKHLVFQGPPGTGKTFIATRLAQVIVAGVRRQIETVQFHPSYSYEDFVQGIRPMVKEGQASYSLKAGHFVEFCSAARGHPDAPFVLLIDEMNRGNLPRIFGELLFLLEYRHESVRLAQSDQYDERFSVPENLYIIATMNTADRSIALIDHALRRRFTFVFLEPDYEQLRKRLKDFGCDSKQLPEVLKQINAAIGDRNYHLGTSFFLSAGSKLKECIKDIWQGEVEPYLDEYFFDQPSKVDDYRWDRLAESTLSWWRNILDDPNE